MSFFWLGLLLVVLLRVSRYRDLEPRAHVVRQNRGRR